MAWWNAILPVVTFVLGWGGTIFTEAKRDERQLARERSLRIEQRRTAREDRREDFELTTLKQLLGSLDRLGRAMARYDLIDVQISKVSGMYGSNRIPDPDGSISEELRLAYVEMDTFVGLTLDDRIRESARVAGAAMIQLNKGPKTLGEAEVERNEARRLAAIAQMAITDRIRELYVEVDPGITRVSRGVFSGE
jgi:hypothetical protein